MEKTVKKRVSEAIKRVLAEGAERLDKARIVAQKEELDLHNERVGEEAVDEVRVKERRYLTGERGTRLIQDRRTRRSKTFASLTWVADCRFYISLKVPRNCAHRISTRPRRVT